MSSSEPTHPTAPPGIGVGGRLQESGAEVRHTLHSPLDLRTVSQRPTASAPRVFHEPENPRPNPAMRHKRISRRAFLATGAAATALLPGWSAVRRRGFVPEPLRIGVIGTGGRGTGACSDALQADPGVELIAMADIGRDRIDQSLEALRGASELQDPSIQARVSVTEEAIFVGPDAYRDVLALDLDYVILTAPPGFRPLHYEEAVRQGRHVFAEKPVATDPAGCRAIRASALRAKQQGLSVVVGLNARHDLTVIETVERIHDRALGEITAGSIHRLGGGLWHRGSDPSWSPMEYQMRNWYYFCWLSGDQIVEMVVHQIDLMNWALGATPVSALAQGGRLLRTDPKYGNIYDHMTVDYTYPGGVHVHLMCRQWDDCASKNANRLIGTLGDSDSRRTITGVHAWQAERRDDLRHNSSVYEHMELIQSIRSGEARNDLLGFAVDSTLTAIMGRESAYTGQVVTWDEISRSDLNLLPPSTAFGPAPERSVPRPGRPRLA